MHVCPAERSHISGPNVLISASLVVVFFETVPAAFLLTLAWLEADFGLSEQEHSRPPRAGDYLQPPFWLTSFLTPSNEHTIGHGSPVLIMHAFFFFFFFFFFVFVFACTGRVIGWGLRRAFRTPPTPSCHRARHTALCTV